MTLTPRDLDKLREIITEVAPVDARPYLTAAELARRLRLSPRTVRTLLATGAIASYMIGGSRRISPADLDAYLASCREDAAA